MSSPPLLSPSDLTQSIQKKRQRIDKRDACGKKLVSNFSPEFLSKYVDWRKSRFEALISKRICDSGWYQALSNDHIWHNWFLDGIVESDTIVSRSTLAHIYDNVKAKPSGTTPSIGPAKRGPLVLHRARNALIRFKPQIDLFSPLQLRGQRPTR